MLCAFGAGMPKACVAQDALAAPGLHRDVIFSYSAQPSESREILRRMLTPLAFAQMEK
ncbi:MAG: hypothetical protein JSR55_12045, partial [Proteobacteria bacterium]|nr:hypothetical protein [Pseudomonadota bacterium]